MAAVPTPRAAAYAAAVVVRFPGAHPSGLVDVCRHIIPHDGSSSSAWSEHSWGNAVDIGGSAALMAKVMAWTQAHSAFFGVNNLIGPGSAVNVVHVDFLPGHAGQVPPCAGGPNVVSPGATTVTPKDITGKNPCPPGKLLLQGVCVDPFPNGPGGITIPGSGILGNIGDFLGKLPRYLEIGGGAFVMLAGLGVLLVGATGQQNKAAGVVLNVTGAARGKLSARKDAADYEAAGGYWSRRENNTGPSIEGIGGRARGRIRGSGEAA
jgi:hypothetical protein